jgi:predicted transcriptional regulator
MEHFQLVPLFYKAKENSTCRKLSSGMLRRVALVRTDVSEELCAFIITVTRIDELGTTLELTGNRRITKNYKVSSLLACLRACVRACKTYTKIFLGVCPAEMSKLIHPFLSVSRNKI